MSLNAEPDYVCEGCGYRILSPFVSRLMLNGQIICPYCGRVMVSARSVTLYVPSGICFHVRPASIRSVSLLPCCLICVRRQTVAQTFNDSLPKKAGVHCFVLIFLLLAAYFAVLCPTANTSVTNAPRDAQSPPRVFTVYPITGSCTINADGYYVLQNDIQTSGDCITVTGGSVTIDGNGYSITGPGNGVGTAIKMTSTNGASDIARCRIKNFRYGIRVEDTVPYPVQAYHNDISSNVIGIYLFNNNNEIKKNFITNNDWGLYIEIVSSGNLVYDNYLQNSKNAKNEGGATWNTTKTSGTNIIGGPYLGGNYWSDYGGLDSDGDGLGDTPYSISGPGGGSDQLPLVDVNAPQYSNNITCPESPAEYSPFATYNFNITWTDNVDVSTVFIEHNLTGGSAPHNETVTARDGDTYYFSVDGLAAGTYSYRWYANDTRNNWNSTDILSFIELPPSASGGSRMPYLN